MAEDAQKNFIQFSLCALDGTFYWSVEAEAFSSRVLQYMIDLTDEDIIYYGRDRTIEVKCFQHVSKVAKGMLVHPSSPLI